MMYQDRVDQYILYKIGIKKTSKLVVSYKISTGPCMTTLKEQIAWKVACTREKKWNLWYETIKNQNSDQKPFLGNDTNKIKVHNHKLKKWELHKLTEYM